MQNTRLWKKKGICVLSSSTVILCKFKQLESIFKIFNHTSAQYFKQSNKSKVTLFQLKFFSSFNIYSHIYTTNFFGVFPNNLKDALCLMYYRQNTHTEKKILQKNVYGKCDENLFICV